MADFIQTMKDWRRMCKTIGAENCEGCKLHADGNDCVAVYEGEMDYAKVEKAVTDWAAENPNPVYPSWYGWLSSMGIVPIVVPLEYAVMVADIGLLKKIPAETAQKLGIEPKEG